MFTFSFYSSSDMMFSPDSGKTGPGQPGPPGQFHVPPPGFPQWGGGWPPQWPGAPNGPPPPIQVNIQNRNMLQYLNDA